MFSSIKSANNTMKLDNNKKENSIDNKHINNK